MVPNPGWPFGLTGMYSWNGAPGALGVDGIPDPPPRTVQSEEDRARALIDTEDEGFLSLVYSLLHGRGFRIDVVHGRIDKWRRNLSKQNPLP